MPTTTRMWTMMSGGTCSLVCRGNLRPGLGRQHLLLFPAQPQALWDPRIRLALCRRAEICALRGGGPEWGVVRAALLRGVQSRDGRIAQSRARQHPPTDTIRRLWLIPNEVVGANRVGSQAVRNVLQQPSSQATAHAAEFDPYASCRHARCIATVVERSRLRRQFIGICWLRTDC
jgi:hypothetical protein